MARWGHMTIMGMAASVEWTCPWGGALVLGATGASSVSMGRRPLDRQMDRGSQSGRRRRVVDAVFGEAGKIADDQA